MVLVLVDDEERERENGWCRWSAHCASRQETVAVAMVLVLVDDEESENRWLDEENEKSERRDEREGIRQKERRERGRGENKGKRGLMRKVPRWHFLPSEIRKE
jgi:hypothetical protein